VTPHVRTRRRWEKIIDMDLKKKLWGRYVGSSGSGSGLEQVIKTLFLIMIKFFLN
jgi:hypothetical protein